MFSFQMLILMANGFMNLTAQFFFVYCGRVDQVNLISHNFYYFLPLIISPLINRTYRYYSDRLRVSWFPSFSLYTRPRNASSLFSSAGKLRSMPRKLEFKFINWPMQLTKITVTKWSIICHWSYWIIRSISLLADSLTWIWQHCML